MHGSQFHTESSLTTTTAIKSTETRTIAPASQGQMLVVMTHPVAPGEVPWVAAH